MIKRLFASPAKWYVLYILGTLVGVVLGNLQAMQGGEKIFGAYLALFLGYHAVVPYLTSKAADTRAQAILAWLPKVVFPLTSLFGWMVLWVIFLK